MVLSQRELPKLKDADVKCKKHQAASKRIELYKVPDILVICIKRFGSSRRLSDKASAAFWLALTLSWTIWLSSQLMAWTLAVGLVNARLPTLWPKRARMSCSTGWMRRGSPWFTTFVSSELVYPC